MPDPVTATLPSCPPPPSPWNEGTRIAFLGVFLLGISFFCFSCLHYHEQQSQFFDKTAAISLGSATLLSGLFLLHVGTQRTDELNDNWINNIEDRRIVPITPARTLIYSRMARH